MKKTILYIALLLFTTNIGLAQDTLYFNAKWTLTSKLNKTFTRVVKLDKQNLSFQGPFEDRDSIGNTITKGEYINNNKNGLFKFFYLDGALEREGKYGENHPIGSWKLYYPNGQLKLSLELEGNDFKIIEYYDKNGKSLLTNSLNKFKYQYGSNTYILGTIVNGEKDGKWELFENGKLIGYDIYKSGRYKKSFEPLFKKFTKNKFITSRVFTPHYLSYSESLHFEDGTLTKQDYSFIPGLPSYEFIGGVGWIDERATTELDSPPLFLGGLERLKKIIMSSANPKPELWGESGRIIVELFVNKSGDIFDIKLLSSNNEKLNYEAMRIATYFTGWKPAILNELPIDSKITIPIDLRFEESK